MRGNYGFATSQKTDTSPNKIAFRMTRCDTARPIFNVYEIKRASRSLKTPSSLPFEHFTS